MERREHPYSDRIVWDMDGLICEDCPSESDDDGPRYLDWDEIREAEVSRPGEAGSRLPRAAREKWRFETLAWLDRHGIQAN